MSISDLTGRTIRATMRETNSTRVVVRGRVEEIAYGILLMSDCLILDEDLHRYRVPRDRIHGYSLRALVGFEVVANPTTPDLV